MNKLTQILSSTSSILVDSGLNVLTLGKQVNRIINNHMKQIDGNGLRVVSVGSFRKVL